MERVLSRASAVAPIRAAAVAAVAVLGAAALSCGIAAGGHAVLLVWLPSSVALVAVLVAGPAAALGAAAAGAAWIGIEGGTALQAASLAAACGLAPLAAAAAWRAWTARIGDESQFRRTLGLLLVSAGVLAPASALLGLHANPILPGISLGSTLHDFAWAYAVEAATAVVVVRAALSLVPEHGGACPIEALRSGASGATPAETACWAVFAVALGGAGFAVAHGHPGAARLALVGAFAIAVLFALVSRRRAASLMLVVGAVAVAWLRGRAEPFDGDPEQLLNLAQHVLLTGLGGAMAHLLNAVSSERLLQAQRLHALAMTHETSGLPNRRAFEEQLAEPGRRAHRPLQLVEIGLAEVHRWAELWGRTEATRLERSVAHRLRDAFVPDGAQVAHLAAGRFGVMLDDRHDEEALLACVQRAVDPLRIPADGGRLSARAVVGVLDVPPSYDGDVDALLAGMSLAHRRAQDDPRHVHRMPMSVDVLDAYRAELRWLQTVRVAVEQGRVTLLAQPIVRARGGDGDRLHYEVLARLLDDGGRPIPPARFLPALSRMRMLEDFDRLVVRTALGHLARDAALRERTAAISINLTGPSVADPRMPSFLQQELRRHAIDPSTVVIEITESESMSRMETAMANARRMADDGLSIALDDFGTGLATFDYLRRFGPHWVKIDGSFVRAMYDGPLGRQIVDSIVRAARAAGAETVAECIEDQALARAATELGVDWLQGYGIARPMPLDEIARFRPAADPGGRPGTPPAAEAGRAVASDAA